jgi:hypothetical protein
MRALATDQRRPMIVDVLSAERCTPDLELDYPLDRFENEGGRVLPPAAMLAPVAQSRAVARDETFE